MSDTEDATGPVKYRKKPVVIEAMRVPDSSDTPAFGRVVGWLLDHSTPCYAAYDPFGKVGGLFISTLEGEMRADIGDWVIKGVAGEFYPCKPDIFAATYERAS